MKIGEIETCRVVEDRSQWSDLRGAAGMDMACKLARVAAAHSKQQIISWLELAHSVNAGFVCVIDKICNFKYSNDW